LPLVRHCNSNTSGWIFESGKIVSTVQMRSKNIDLLILRGFVPKQVIVRQIKANHVNPLS